MKILFVTAQPYLPQLYGGSLATTNQLCSGLQQRGHQAAVLAGFKHGGFFALKCRIQKILLRRKFSKDIQFGYPVWRSWFPDELLELAIKKEKPDLIVTTAGASVQMALTAKQSGIPVLMLLQDAEIQNLCCNFGILKNTPSIANSHFNAKKYRDAFGFNPGVIHPLISPERYKVKTTRENITFINPLPIKGRDVALEIARLCPDIPFTFVEAWLPTDEQKSELTEKLSTLPNVAYLPAHKDMRKIYGKCKILLVPSIWQEAYGRVVTEAQISGIPVVASTRGGLPEAVGPGGITIDPDGPIEAWVAAIRRLWQDDAYYSDIASKALTYASRPEMNLAYQIDAWEKAMLKAAGGLSMVEEMDEEMDSDAPVLQTA